MKSVLAILVLVGIQWISTSNGQSACKHKLLPSTFIRCCRLDKYFTVSTVDECVAKCNEHNFRKQPSEQACTRVNYQASTKECSLLYSQPGNDPSIFSSHPEFTGAELDCSGGGGASPSTARPTTQPPVTQPPSKPSKGVGCGVPSPNYPPVLPNKNTRIIGGNTARPHSWPWQVSLRSSGGQWHFCGGSLLRVHEDKEESDIVLTAAHCVPTEKNGAIGDFSYMSVVAGTQTQERPTPGQEVRQVADIQYHRDYLNLVNDIAILKLDRPIRFSDKIRPICVAREGEGAPTQRTCMAVGWGRNESHTQNSQDELKQALTPVHSIETCQSNWYYQQHAWSYAFLCAGPLDASSAVCNGDSGGPLICRNDDNSWAQYGIASFVAHTGCTQKNQPPVFARVSTYAGWIREKISKMSSLLQG